MEQVCATTSGTPGRAPSGLASRFSWRHPPPSIQARVHVDEFANGMSDGSGRTAVHKPDTEACLVPSPHGRDDRLVLEAARHGHLPLPPVRALRALLAYCPDTPYQP